MRRTLNISLMSETGNVSINMVMEDADNGTQKIVIQAMEGMDGVVKERLQRRNEEPRYSLSSFRFNGIQIEEQNKDVQHFMLKCCYKLIEATLAAVKVEYSVEEEVQEFPCNSFTQIHPLDTFLREIQTLMSDELSTPFICQMMLGLLLDLQRSAMLST